MSRQVLDEAKRCLQCKNPACTMGCPIGAPIKEAITLLLDSQLEQAGQLLFDNNPLALVCSYVCPQENQCEGHCVLGRKGMPIFISEIEKYISDFYLDVFQPMRSSGEKGKIAIIGSGPAGITIAFILAGMHYDVTIFEGNSHIGGVLRYGIPEFRLPKSVLDRMVDILYRSGVRIRPNTVIGMNLGIDDLFHDGFRAVFIGTGVWRPFRLNIRGESLGHVHYAIEYLKSPSEYRLGGSLIIIGAGNVAVDAARTAVRRGCRDVKIFVHLDESGITARPGEVEYAKLDGIKFELMKTAVEITDKGVMFADSEIYLDETGGKHTRPIPHTETLEEADSVIIAISQGPRSVIRSSTTGIAVNPSGLIVVDQVGQSTREGVFAGGDVVMGAKTVVEAVRVAGGVAIAMDEFVRGKYSD